LDFVLDQMDFTNVGRVVTAVNESFGGPIASPVDGRSIRLTLPVDYQKRPVDFIAAVEAVTVQVDSKARVVVNERTGTVVIGSEVTLSAVSISHGNLSIQIETEFQVSQPAPFSQGQTTTVPQSSVKADEQKSNFVTLNKGATVDDLIKGIECAWSDAARHHRDPRSRQGRWSSAGGIGNHMIPGLNSLTNTPLDPKDPKVVAAKVESMSWKS